MTLEQKRKALVEAVKDLQAGGDMSALERQAQLVEVGFAAASVDLAALGHPDEVEIKSVTDELVATAEGTVEIKDQHDELIRVVSSQVRTSIGKPRKV